MTPIFLTPPEVVELTHKRTRPAQVRALRGMGIEHKIRPDGSIAISRSHVEKVLGGDVPANSVKRPDWKPDWSTVR